MTAAFVYDAIRTPFGRFGGGLAKIRPDDLAATVIKDVLERSPNFDPERLDEIVFGNANGAGEDNRNVGRMAGLLAGLPVSVPGTTVNRLCGSSLDAAMIASRTIETGDAEIVLTGGVESMSRAPWVLPKPDRAFPAGDISAPSTTLGWRLVNPAMPAEWTVSLGEANEQLEEKHRIGRDRMDAFAMRSHRLADEAWTAGFFDDLTTAVPGADLARDENIRAGTPAEKMAALKPVFRPDGTITAGNASPLSDGASAVLLGSESAAPIIGGDPVARIAGRAAYALEPQFFGYAPVEAANSALRRAGIGWSEVGAVELNEAFAVQSLACVDAWGIDPEIVNTRGGAIAIGHPLGASGGRILGTLAKVLRERGERWGVAAICIGVGQGLAVVLENLIVDNTAPSGPASEPDKEN
jgi:acetyl-CoA acyltransferase